MGIGMEVADAYVRASYLVGTEKEFNNLAQALEARVILVARGYFNEGVELNYLLEEGTLLGRVKVIGALIGAIYVAVSQYPDFRQGVLKIHEDAKAFGEAVVQEFKSVTGITNEHILKKRTMSRDVGALYRIVRNLDGLRTSSPERQRTLKQRIIADLARLCRSYPHDHEVLELLALLKAEELPDLPQTPQEIIAADENRRRKRQELKKEQEPITATGTKPRPRFRYEKTFRL